MRLRWTILLIIINAILIWLVAGGLLKPATHRTFEAQIRSFLPLQKGEWDYLALATDKGEWKAQRDSWGRWWLKSPIEWPGRTDRFSKMVAFLTTLKIESAFSSHQLKRVGQSLRSYGLEKPQAILEVGSQGKTLTYKIGTATPLGEKLYVLSPKDDEIWVVSRELLNYTDPAFEPYRADGFFPFDVVELESATIQMDDDTLKIERKATSEKWQIVFGEEKVDVVDGVWESFLEELSTLAPAEFVALDAEAQGLKTPMGRLIFKTLYGRRALLIGSMANPQDRWVQWEGSKSVFSVPQMVLDKLTVSSFLSDTLIHMPVSSITQIGWKTPAGEIVLGEGEEGWEMSVDGVVSHADATKVKQYLVYLASQKAQPSLKEPSFAQSAPQLSVKTDKMESVYRFSGDLKSGAVGVLHYAFDGAFVPPNAEALKDNAMAKAPEGAKVVAVSVGQGEGALSYEVDSPVFSAAVSLAEKPEVIRWLGEASVPEGATSMEITWDNQSVWTIQFWKEENWLAAYNAKVFEPTPEWAALFDNISKQ